VPSSHTIYCGGVRGPRRLPKNDRELRLWGKHPNVQLESGALSHALATELSPRHLDLLELAAYVYAADQAIDRGPDTGADLGERWRRDFKFVIGVRDRAFWSQAKVGILLSEALGFVSDDSFAFEFRNSPDAPAPLPHLPFTTGAKERVGADSVIAFSGGIDSLAGSVDEVIRQGRTVALVSHRAATKLDPIQRGLADAIRGKFPRDPSQPLRVHHFPTWIRKAEDLDVEPTQRTRSFLFAALTGVVARALELSEARFYENGVVSLNLPVCGQVVGARATRTTHPKTLTLFARFFSEVFDIAFRFENPFLWKTKAEVINVLSANQSLELLAQSMSCAHTRAMTERAKHCGACSQCIDRRFGVLAAGAESYERAQDYRAALFTAARTTVEEQTMLETYVRRAREIRGMDDHAFLNRFPEVNRVLPYVSGTTTRAARQVIELYRRHANEVFAVLEKEVARSTDSIAAGRIEPRSLLGMIVGTSGGVSTSRKARRSRAIPKIERSVVRLLHISDTHFSRDRWDQDHVLSALADDVAVMRDALGPPDLVFFTGDIAQSGLRREYKTAEAWLSGHLLPAAGVGPGALIMVPGNHDVDRTRMKLPGKSAHKALLQLKSQDEVAKLLRDPDARKSVLSSHAAWLSFTKRMGRLPSAVPWFEHQAVVRGTSIHVAALCSSWCAYSNEDHGKLILGRFQINETLKDADLVVAAMHHPWDMITEFDVTEVREEVRRKSDIVLRGHLHASEGAQIVTPGNEVLELAAGASYAGSSFPNAYHWIEAYPSDRRVRLHMRSWDKHSWIADRNAYGGVAKDGYCDFEFGNKKPGAGRRRA
jgi:calcineurin-like phosphoesterase family protein